MSSIQFSKCFRAIRLAAAALLSFSTCFATVDAAVLLYDSFSTTSQGGDYLLGNDATGVNVLGGQNPPASPTAFYSSPWIQSGGDAQAVRGGSLQYPQFPRAGSRITDRVQFSCCSFGRNGREIAGGLGGGRNPRTIYQSFLVDFGNQGTDDPTQFGLRGVEWWNGGVGDSFLATQLFVNHFSGVSDFRLAVTTPSGTQFAPLNGGGLNLANMAGTHLLVMKFEFDPALPDTVSVYLDPTDSIESNWTPAAVVSAPNSDLFISHHGGRFGDTFADVTPFVPEPGSLALGGFGLAALAMRLRRKRSA
jgi:hypothetical protein